jgi:hypothetical protein
MKVRFQADADLNQFILIATVRCEPSIDFQGALAAGLAGLSDRDVLAKAAGEGRLLLTHDQKTMPRHFSDFISSVTSPGLIIIPQHLPIASVVEDLVLIWLVTEAGEWESRICFLPL